MGYARWVGLAAIVTTVACGRTFVAPLPQDSDDGISRGAPMGSSGGAASGGVSGTGGIVTGGRLAAGGTVDEFGGLPVSGGVFVTGGWAIPGGLPVSGGLSGTGGTMQTGGRPEEPWPGCEGDRCAELLSAGEWAVMTELDVWWDPPYDPFGNPTPAVNAGRGTVRVYQHLSISNLCGGAFGAAYSRLCGVTLPTLTSQVSCDAHAWSFSPATWDNPNAPAFPQQVALGEAEPGGELLVLPLTTLVGIELDDPERPAAAWPSAFEAATFTCRNGAQQGLPCYPDHDGDGMPGITATLAHAGADSALEARCGLLEDQPYVERGVALTLDTDLILPEADQSEVRAIAAHLGLRLRSSSGGLLNATCDSTEGNAGASYLQTRIISCTRLDGTPCTAAQAQFLDEQTPEFHILQKGEAPAWTVAFPAWTVADSSESAGPKSRLVRIGDAGAPASCDIVRQAFTKHLM